MCFLFRINLHEANSNYKYDKYGFFCTHADYLTRSNIRCCEIVQFTYEREMSKFCLTAGARIVKTCIEMSKSAICLYLHTKLSKVRFNIEFK